MGGWRAIGGREVSVSSGEGAGVMAAAVANVRWDLKEGIRCRRRRQRGHMGRRRGILAALQLSVNS